MTFRKILLSVAVLGSSNWVSPAALWAHPGHGTEGQGQTIAHYATEPIHQWPWAVAILLVGVAIFALRQHFRAKTIS